MTAEAERAYTDAVRFYKKSQLANKGNMLGYTSSTLLVQACIGGKRFEQAGRVLEENIKNYPAPALLAQQLSYVDLIFVRILNNPDKAIEIYSYAKEKTDSEDLGDILSTTQGAVF